MKERSDEPQQAVFYHGMPSRSSRAESQQEKTHLHRHGMSSSSSQAFAALLQALNPADGWQVPGKVFSDKFATASAGSNRAPAHSRTPAPTMEIELNDQMIPRPLEVLGNNVLIKLDEFRETTGGGLFLSDKALRSSEGVVVATGPGAAHPESAKLLPCPIKEGDTVLIGSKYTDLTYDGANHVLVDAKDVLATFDGGTVSAGTFRPTRNRVLVDLADEITETASGIALSSGAEGAETFNGEVISVGPGTYTKTGDVIAPRIKKGDSVMFEPETGVEIELDGKKFRLFFEEECMATW